MQHAQVERRRPFLTLLALHGLHGGPQARVLGFRLPGAGARRRQHAIAFAGRVLASGNRAGWSGDALAGDACTAPAARACKLGTRRIALGERLVAGRLGAAQTRLGLGGAALHLGDLGGHLAHAAAVQMREHVHLAEHLRHHLGRYVRVRDDRPIGGADLARVRAASPTARRICSSVSARETRRTAPS